MIKGLNPNIPKEIVPKVFGSFQKDKSHDPEERFKKLDFHLVWNTQLEILLFCAVDKENRKHVIYCNDHFVFKNMQNFILRNKWKFDLLSECLRDMYLEITTMEKNRFNFIDFSQPSKDYPHLHLIYTFKKFPTLQELLEEFPEYDI